MPFSPAPLFRRNTAADPAEELRNTGNIAGKERTQVTAPGAAKVTRQKVIDNMAARLSASVFRNLPAEKKQPLISTRMRIAAADLLKDGMDVETVAEKLMQLFG